MIVTVAGFKGGVGKTTTAVHLACFFAGLDGKTLLVDGDPNRSSMGWAERGNLPFAVCDFAASVKASRAADHIVVDTEAHPDNETLETLADGCDLLILPTTADALGLEALLNTTEALKRLSAYSVLLTKVDSRKMATAEQARVMLESQDIPVFDQVIRQLTAYEKAALAGVPVQGSGDRMASIAWKEYRAVGEEVLKYDQGV
ncbi:MAG: ParA family protein [Leptolyngbya foveolarum]|uniref:ParA family protein n=1 Tax=Leptolyngbya foveolarum TaxID=47253 RepID=A0A2W4UVH4_9CYAN|nr:MAG: ParA family protein [Leptolyngbya foveolarum]